MQVTSITEFATAPGTYLEWPVDLGDGTFSNVPPSFNQSFHLSSALCATGTDGAAVWIAVAFDVSGSVDIDAMTWSIAALVERHAALRSSFRARGSAIERLVHDGAHISVSHPRAHILGAADDVSSHLRARFDEMCRPTRSPSYCFAAIDRVDRSTVVCGFDHAHVDAVSMTVVADELTALYDARKAGRPVDADIGAVGSFVEFCAEEAQTPEVPSTDPRIRSWAQFVAGSGGSTPTFPFDLGVPSDGDAPQATTIEPLMSAVAADCFERRCRSVGAGMFAGMTAGMAQTVAEIGGPSTLPMLFPLHTRRDARWATAIGWFTTNAPMVVDVGADFDATLASAHSSFRAALPLGTVPIPRVLGALGNAFTRTRHDVFMISYIDYRALPGAHATKRSAHHISNVTTADDAQFWVSRTADGLALRSRFPDTPTAHAVMARFVSRLIEVLHGEVLHDAALQDETLQDEALHDLSLVAPTA
ncbi:MAG: condensation domain-containing protein [Rhodococcus sp. (in: high G+C Gram-positive bacteria)]